MIEEKEHVLNVLQNVKKALRKKNYVEIKNLSDNIIHISSIHQNSDIISLAVIIYSLSKLIERESYKTEKNWDKFYEGYVKNIEGFYRKSSVFIVPIRSGGGIRIKILKALSHGIPVVSTKIGSEGINLLNDRQILLADNHKDFARQIINLITNPLLAQKLNKQGIKFIKNNYSDSKTRNVLNILTTNKYKERN